MARQAPHLEVEATAARDRALAAARQRAADPDLAVDRRVEEIALLALDSYAQVGATLLALMEPRLISGNDYIFEVQSAVVVNASTERLVNGHNTAG